MNSKIVIICVALIAFAALSVRFNIFMKTLFDFFSPFFKVKTVYLSFCRKRMEKMAKKVKVIRKCGKPARGRK